MSLWQSSRAPSSSVCPAPCVPRPCPCVRALQVSVSLSLFSICQPHALLGRLRRTGAHTLQRPFRPSPQSRAGLSRSPAVGVTSGAVPGAHGAIPEVPQESDIGAEVESALKGHAGVQQSRGGAHEPIGDDSPLRPDAVGLRGHAAPPTGSPHRHTVPEVGPPRGREAQGGDESGSEVDSSPKNGGGGSRQFHPQGLPSPHGSPLMGRGGRDAGLPLVIT